MIGVETIDGKFIDKNHLVKLVPDNVFTSETHVNFAILLASNTFLENELKRKVFINLLVKYSNLVRLLTAIKFLQQHNQIQVKTVFLPEIIKNRIHTDLFENIECIYLSGKYHLVDRVSPKNMFLKAIAHKFYRIIGVRTKSKLARSTAIVRCYVEVSEFIHKKEIGSSLCVFFPFPYKLSRQYSFYKHCRSKGFRTAFFGVPYSIFSSIKLFFKLGDTEIVNFEYSAYYNHAMELSKYNLKYYYTEDDYVAASFIVGKYLMESGCFVVNRSHGVGYDCPYVYTHLFEVLSRPQFAYYALWNANRDIKFQYLDREQPKSIDNASLSEEVCFIFVHSNFKDHQCIYESNLQEKIIRELNIISQEHLYDIRIKYHPNTTIKEDTALREVVSFDEVNKIKILLSINSTSFFTHTHHGLYIFFGDELCTPHSFVDQEALYFHVNDIRSVLANFSNLTSIHHGLESQRKLISQLHNKVECI